MSQALKWIGFPFMLFGAVAIARAFIVHPGLLTDLSSDGLIGIAGLIVSVYGSIVFGVAIYRSLVSPTASNADGQRKDYSLREVADAYQKHPVLAVLVVAFPVVLIVLFTLWSR